MLTCDICDEIAMDSLKPKSAPEGVVDLCTKHANEIYDFENKLIKINYDRISKKQPMISKCQLVKAKAICMKNGLNMSINEPVFKRSLWRKFLHLFR